MKIFLSFLTLYLISQYGKQRIKKKFKLKKKKSIFYFHFLNALKITESSRSTDL